MSLLATGPSGLARLLDEDIPTGWTWAVLASVAECRLGKMLDRAKNRGNPVPYLRNVNIRWFSIDLGDLKSMRFEADEIVEFALRPGDVLVCEGGEPGRAAVWVHATESMVFQKALHRVRPGERLDAGYLCHWLRFITARGWLEPFLTGSTIKHLPAKNLASLPVLLPPIERQREIVATLDAVTSMTSQALGEIDEARMLVRALMRSRSRRLLGLDDGRLPHRTLADVADVVAVRHKITRSTYLREGPVPVIDQGEGLVAGYTDDLDAQIGGPPFVLFGDHTRRIKYVDFPFAQGADGLKVLRPRPGVDAKWLAAVLENALPPSRGYGRHFALLRTTKLPHLELTKQRIAAEQIDALERLVVRWELARERILDLARMLDLSSRYAAFNDRLPMSYVDA